VLEANIREGEKNVHVVFKNRSRGQPAIERGWVSQLIPGYFKYPEDDVTVILLLGVPSWLGKLKVNFIFEVHG
jgi:hypothetical protein